MYFVIRSKVQIDEKAKYCFWANILLLTHTSAKLLWISWRMLRMNYFNLSGGKIDYCRTIKLYYQSF